MKPFSQTLSLDKLLTPNLESVCQNFANTALCNRTMDRMDDAEQTLDDDDHETRRRNRR
jgi:hypothetical protein